MKASGALPSPKMAAAPGVGAGAADSRGEPGPRGGRRDGGGVPLAA